MEQSISVVSRSFADERELLGRGDHVDEVERRAIEAMRGKYTLDE